MELTNSSGSCTFVYTLVIHSENISLLVEPQLQVVRQFDVITIALLLNLGDDALGEVLIHILLDNLWDQHVGNGLEVIAVNLLPLTLLVEVNLCSVVQMTLIDAPFFLGIDNLLSIEVGGI